MSNNGTSTGSNDVDLDASWQTNLIACAAATWAIAAVFVALRFYLRGHMLHVLGREDWMILVALFFSAAYSIGYIVDAHFGFGKHAAALSPATLSIVTETYWLGMLWFTTTVLFTKLSILFLYLRTLTHLWVQRTLRVLLAMVLLTSLTDYILMFTTCIPLKAYWDTSIKAAYCHSMQAYYAILGIQLGTDFFTFLLPLPVIWSMRAPKDQKIMLLVLFSFGFFICVVSIIRLTQLTTTRFKSDFTYDSATTDFWSLIEANTGIVCACIMTMNPLLRRLVPDALLTRRGCESTQDPLGINGGGGAKSGKSGKGGNGGTGGKIMRIRDKSGGHGGTLFFNNYSINPPTIGSKPSRPNTVVVKKQSWFTAQLARLDRSLQTLNEAEGGGVNGDRRRSARSGSSSYETAHTMEAGLHLPPLPASVFLLPVPDMPRRSHHSSSSISTPIEQEIDEGPLEQLRWARRPSCAPSSPGTTRRPSVAAVPPQPGSPIVGTMRRPSCAPSEPGTMRRPSMAPSSPGG